MSVAVSNDLKLLTLGSQGPAVRQFQRDLNRLLQSVNAIADMFVLVDGLFGKETMLSLKYVQCIGGLPVNGHADERTQAFVAHG
ncbi:MAG: hypothetical protein HC800_00815 [Phormidesmis sp. RL_2_1]|nr:hypothetical protein [Phormidesmis sp. RL_2_1]